LQLFWFFAIIKILNKRIKLANMNVFQYFAQLKFLDDPKILLPILAWIVI